MPNEATIEDIEESYLMSWELGVKCMALYRDGSKASQPLIVDLRRGRSREDERRSGHAGASRSTSRSCGGKIPAGMSPTQAYAQGMHPPRFLLPARRDGYTQEARIGGHKVYLRTGEYEDGTLGEVFIDLAKEGATLRGILSCFAIAVSKGLQYGVPLEEFVDTFTFQTFEPRGMVEGHPNIKMANSIVDYVFRALGVEYLQARRPGPGPAEPRRRAPRAAKGHGRRGRRPARAERSAVEGDVDALKKAARSWTASRRQPAIQPSGVKRPRSAGGPKPSDDGRDVQTAGTRAMQSRWRT